MGDIGFGVIGLGMGMGRANLVHDLDGAALVAVCDLDEARLKTAVEQNGCKAYTDFDQMLADDDIDVVYVLTPSGTHLDFTTRAAQAGKHVISTKPLDVTFDRCRQMIDVCAANNVHLVADYESRYYPRVQHIKVAVDAGEFGELLFLEARCKWWRDMDYYKSGGWRGTWKYDGGGSMANQGIHLLDIFLWLAGSVKVVSAHAAVLNHDIETEDFAFAQVEFGNGRLGTLLTTTNHHVGNAFDIGLTGTLGSAELVRENIQVAFEADDRTEPKTPLPDWPKSAADDMVRVLRDGAEPMIPGEEGARAIELLESVYKAAGLR